MQGLKRLKPLVFICILFSGVVIERVAAVNYNECLLDLQTRDNGTGTLQGGFDNNGNPVPMGNATAISYELCKSACGSSQEPFSWTTFSQQFSAWLLPYLALISQLPFGARHRFDNFMSVFLTVGSPTLAAYSLVVTVLNGRWIAHRFEAVHYPNKNFAVRVLNGLLQAPLRITSDNALLASLVVLPQNDDWWSDLAEYLNYTHTWSISAATSIIWVVIAYIFTVVDSLGNVSNSINSNGQAVGSIWLWLIPIVVGWLQLSPKCDSARLHDAVRRANAIAHVARDNDVVRASTINDKRAISVDAALDDGFASLDEDKTPPVYNYARVLSWSQSAEEVVLAFRMASRKAGDNKPVNTKMLWQEGERGVRVQPSNRTGSERDVEAYCELPIAAVRSRWASGVFSRMAIASLVALGIQWGTTGAAVVVVWFTPTTGLGCRSGAFVLYGVISTLILMMLIISSILSHYALHRPRSFPTRCAVLFADMLCRFGKLAAVLNSIWIITICVFQFSNVFDTCYCNSSVLGRGDGAIDVITLSVHDTIIIRGSWIGGLTMASVCAIGFIGFINLWVDPSD